MKNQNFEPILFQKSKNLAFYVNFRFRNEINMDYLICDHIEFGKTISKFKINKINNPIF